MIILFLSFVLLISGYFFYSKFVEKVFGIDENRPTPAYTKNDGIDYVPIKWPRICLIQLLNIAGLGPVFGPIMGALWGPVAFLWIVLGCIFAGAVHDYFSGMLSVRNDGAGLPEIIGKYLGNSIRILTNFFALVLLILVATVFITAPAKLLSSMTAESFSISAWVGVFLLYYIIATLLPIDKIIGRIYPIFGTLLLFMVFCIGGAMIVQGYQIPKLTLENIHPKGLPIWPLMFITIACGAISGFHAIQCPIMARCIQSEKYGRRIFYGMMMGEGLIAMVWAAAGMSFYGNYADLATVLSNGGSGPVGVVKDVAITLLGPVGSIFVIGVIILPVNAGGTAFRSARMIIADFTNYSQKSLYKRFIISLPLFAVSFLLTKIDFNFLWRYFAWANQTLAMIMLWTAAIYLVQKNKFHWIVSIPAAFMTVLTFTYILIAPEGFRLTSEIAYPLGFILTLFPVYLFIKKSISLNNSKVLKKSITIT